MEALQFAPCADFVNVRRCASTCRRGFAGTATTAETLRMMELGGGLLRDSVQTYRPSDLTMFIWGNRYGLFPDLLTRKHGARGQTEAEAMTRLRYRAFEFRKMGLVLAVLAWEICSQFTRAPLKRTEIQLRGYLFGSMDLKFREVAINIMEYLAELRGQDLRRSFTSRTFVE